MASATFVRSDRLFAGMASGYYKLATDTVKVMLTDIAQGSTAYQYSHVTQIGATGGYVTGGFVLTTSMSQSSGTMRWFCADKVITASGAAIPQFRYVWLYDQSTVATPWPLIGYYDYNAEVNIPDGQTFTIDFDGSNGVFSV